MSSVQKILTILLGIVLTTLFLWGEEGKIVLIDPGHGGKDRGVVAGSYKEKNIALALSKNLATILAKRGYHVAMTRYQDAYLSLKERSMIVKQLNPDIVVSIHVIDGYFGKKY